MTPFEQDTARKANGLLDFYNPRLRSSVCANCLVLRKFHYGGSCRKFRRMRDKEWADYCGIGQEKEELRDQLRNVRTTNGVVHFDYDCGHADSRAAGTGAPLPERCPLCAKGEKDQMWMNGKSKDQAPASVSPPAAAVEPVRALVVVSDANNGSTSEVSRFMPVMDIQQAIARREVLKQAVAQLMVEGVDYGKIPGCGDKPALLLPGADKLCNLFGLTLQYDFLEKTEDWTGAQHGGEPFFYYQVSAKVFRGEFLIAEGVGACHSWESKYRWRKMERVCPACGKENIRHSRDGGWYCWRRTEGCGATFDDGDPAIEGQPVGKKPNPDVLDSVNTILKIAYKRTKIHGTINATSASDFFTQDIEDFSVSDENGPDTGGHPQNTQAAANHVAQEKIRTGNVQTHAPWKNMREVADSFQKVRERVGEVAYREELERYGWHTFQDMRAQLDSPNSATRNAAKQKAAEIYTHLDALARKEGK